MPDTTPQSKSPRIVAGCMTGTSLDGLDVALVRIDGHGLEMKPTLIGHHAVSMPGDLRDTLMHLASGGAAEPIVYLRAARQLGLFHAEGLAELFSQHPGDKPDFITAHGQTIWHAPRDSADLGPMSWQLLDPWPIVQRHGAPVCYDLRQADLIAGGEGAPLTPIADGVMYREHADLVINLGGVCNYTFLPAEPAGIVSIEGGDACHCNLLLDGLAQRLLHQPYDADGQAAASGIFDESLYRDIADRFPVGGGTLGREGIGPALDRLVADHHQRTAQDFLLNAVAFVGQSIGEVFESYGATRLVFAGGGARNRALIQYTRDIIEPDSFCEGVYRSDDLGIPCEAREAMGWAVLGALSQDGVAVSLPQVTGATDPGVAGVWAGVNRRFSR